MTAERSLTHDRMNSLIPPAARARRSSYAAASSTLGQRMSDDKPLRRLNARYIRAHLTGDIARYQARLADDFVCIESDGRILDTANSLARSPAAPVLWTTGSPRSTCAVTETSALSGRQALGLRGTACGARVATPTCTCGVEMNGRSYPHRSLA